MTQLMAATEYWTTRSDVIYLDFKKAFDSVPYRRLLTKLKAYGIDGLVLKWIESFLPGRKQRMVLNNSYSCWSDVISGIPHARICFGSHPLYHLHK